MVKTYDTACYNVARSFLSDAAIDHQEMDRLADLLAKEIQQCIEDFFAAHDLS